MNPRSTIQDEEDKEEWKTQTLNPHDDDETSLLMAFINDEGEEIWINQKATLSTDMAIEELKKQKEKTPEEMIPPELMDYKDIFNKKAADRLPESKSYNQFERRLYTKGL
jgi:hypothetical protein